MLFLNLQHRSKIGKYLSLTLTSTYQYTPFGGISESFEESRNKFQIRKFDSFNWEMSRIECKRGPYTIGGFKETRSKCGFCSSMNSHARSISHHPYLRKNGTYRTSQRTFCWLDTPLSNLLLELLHLSSLDSSLLPSTFYRPWAQPPNSPLQQQYYLG